MTTISSSHLRVGQVSHLRVDRDHAGRRIDNLLISLLGDIPKSHIYRMLRRGEVRVNGKRVRPESRVSEDDLVRLPPLQRGLEATRLPTAGRRGDFLQQQILYEDPSLLVLNKPAGMAVHGGSGLRYGLIETLRNARGGEGFLELAHRLDRDTSGCLVLAKTMRDLRRLHSELRQGAIGKRYLLLARGMWRGGDRTVQSALSKSLRSGGEAVVAVDPDGKHAVTRFALERQYDGTCLLTADLQTGRTHQIRVHATHCGHPIAGDEKYGDEEFNLAMRRHGLRRLFLHAARVEIPLEKGAAPLVVDAPLPVELMAVLNSLATASGEACDNSQRSTRRKNRT